MFHLGILRKYGAVGVALCLVLACIASCNNPQSPPPAGGDAIFQGLYEPGGTLEFRIETPSGNPSALRLVASDLLFDASTQQLHAQVSIRNAGSEMLPGPNVVQIDGINPDSVVPVNALPLPCPTPQRCLGSWEFTHQGTYGGDHMLSPGETSSPIEWVFADSTGQSFSFRASLRPGDATRPGIISGSAFADRNGDGRRQPSEPGLAGVTVSLTHGDSNTTITTEMTGSFEFQVAEAGLYEIVREANTDCAPTTPSRLQVFILKRPDGTLSGYSGIEFGCRGSIPVEEILVIGIVFEDKNRDGSFQEGERGLPGVLITGAALACPTFAPIQAHTDADGRYALRLPACQPPYVVSHEPVPGFVDTSPNPLILLGMGTGPPVPVPMPVPMPDSLPAPGDSTVVTHRAHFGVAPRDPSQESSVEGVVFEDANHNGLRENNEPGIPGVEVTASGILCMTPVLGVTHTDASGHYILRAADVHCPLPWRVAHAGIAETCDTSPNPVEVGYDMRPDPRHYRINFGVASCDSLPNDGELITFVHWQNQGLPDRRVEIVELGQVQVTNARGVAKFTLPPGVYTLHADVNGPGPPIGVDLSVTVRRGQTTRIEVIDCLPCVALE